LHPAPRGCRRSTTSVWRKCRCPAAARAAILLAITLWGLSAWAFFPAQQARLISIAGVNVAPGALSLNASFQFLGFSTGAALGSLTMANASPLALGWVGASCVLGALALVLATSRHVAPGRDGLFNLIRTLPATLKYENQLIVAEGDYVIAHGRFSGNGRPAAWIAADIVRVEDGKLAEHWDVLQDEATQAESLRARLRTVVAARVEMIQARDVDPREPWPNGRDSPQDEAVSV
jgi:SnoaL-like protein